MTTVARILLGAALTGISCWALGLALLRCLRLHLFTRAEEHLLAFVSGAPLMSLAVFTLTALGQARASGFIILGALALLAAWRAPTPSARPTATPPLPRAWKVVFAAVWVLYAALYFVNALTPEHSPDGSAYHLGFVAQYLRQGGFGRITTNMYASLSQGMEMLFLPAFSLGMHSAASLTHCFFLLALPLLMLHYGQRFGIAKAAAFGALLTFASPVFGTVGTTAYIDVALACVVFTLIYLLHVWAVTQNVRLLVAAGLLAGFCYAIKYTGGLAVPVSLAFIAWRMRRGTSSPWRALATVTGLALLMMLPWMVKNWITVANPFSPFLNRLFPNPYVHISFEMGYLRHMRSYERVKGPVDLLRNILYKGEAVSGILGPIFLLAPLALLSLRRRLGWWMMGAALVFSLPILTNNGTRFLLPGIPFLSIALGMALERMPGALPALAVLHAIVSWPPVLSTYCSPYAWRLNRIPWQAALRRIPEDVYLASIGKEFTHARALDRLTPPSARLFGFDSPPLAYTTRPTLVAYKCAANEVMADVVYTAILPPAQPTAKLRFTFPATEVEAARLSLLDPPPLNAPWTVHEVRLMRQGRELSRSAKWRLRAHPYPWDVQLAFDNNPLTAWKPWQPSEPGAFVEVTLDAPQEIDEVWLEGPAAQERARIAVEGFAKGRWTTLTQTFQVENTPVTINLRHAAVETLRGMGITHLMVFAPDWFREDFEKRSKVWGVTLEADLDGMRLYRLD